MYRVRITILVILLILTGVVAYASSVDVASTYAQGNYELEPFITVESEHEMLFENSRYSYSFRDSRDVLAIRDKRNDYTWKSGLDIAIAAEVKAALRKDEPLGYEPIEARLNTTFTGIANSLVTIEYYDDSNNIKRIASAGEEAESTLMRVKGEDGHFVLLVDSEEIDLSVRVHLFITDKGYDIEIYHEEIKGEGRKILAAVMLNPFLGASGGEYQLYDPEEEKHGEKIPKPEIPGYVLVPDGSGALIRFTDYSVSLKRYEGSVYGKNLSKETYNYAVEWDSFVPFKEPLVPLYGIVHENAAAAFLGYATEGDSHMEIIVVPEENTTFYTWAYPRFEFNTVYYQIFNKRGDGYFTMFEEPDAFDIKFSYEFLSGEGEDGYPANYVGMALAYREHLIETGQLTELERNEGNIPARIDFVMSDQKKSVIGYENVVTTDVENVRDIINDLLDVKDYNLSVGLLGWQDGGRTSAHPAKADYIASIGRGSDFSKLFSDMKDLGVDISFATDYSNINEEQVRLAGNAAKHVNRWYLVKNLWTDVPFTELYYAKPETSAKWLEDQYSKIMKRKPGSHTIDGISSLLISEHGRNPMTEEETMEIYGNVLSDLSEETELNLVSPNKYLWQYTDRFLQAPVYHTQFLINSEAVPFISLVLNGTMDVFGPYSNFSFFGEDDILHMIDFNVYPAFVLTEEGSYLLSATNSQNFYSTEYRQYRDVIENIYEKVNSALGTVRDAAWIGRSTLSEGVVVNSYSDGTRIYINNTEVDYTMGDMIIEAMSFLVER